MTREMTAPEDRLRDMERFGVDLQIVSVTTPNVYFGPPARRRDLARMANDGLADLVRRFPQRFAAMASLPLGEPEAAIRELDRAVLELGMVGAILGSNAGGRYLDGPELYPLFERAQTLEVPILVHPMPPASTIRATLIEVSNTKPKRGTSPRAKVASASAGGIGWTRIGTSRACARSKSGYSSGPSRYRPPALLPRLAPTIPSSRPARSSSRIAASGSPSGRLAIAAKRCGKRRTRSARPSLAILARSRRRAGGPK